ncbi:MAG TPA: hypothetical protein VGN36_07800 [Sphingorhabdus sp.]|jgi:ElaB/YqjD/DUF883 family membrane-anchored ribosome-binding protein|nr:hypothetical protein [Sphingorhabdus sp.]
MSKIGDSIKNATESAKAKTSETSAAARDLARRAKAETSDGIDKNPLAIVLGGVAIGAIIGALLPSTAREKKVMGKAGKKLNKKAKEMAKAAKDAGKQQVDSLGLNGDAVREQFRDLVSKAAIAVKAAGEAASAEARKKD